MDKSFVEIYEFFRDVARNGTGPYDHAQVMAAKRDFQPLSKVEKANQERARNGKHRDKDHLFDRSPAAERHLQCTRASNRRMKMIIGQLGGDLTTRATAPAYDGDALRRIRNPVDRPIDNTVLEGPEGWREEQKRAHAAKRDHIVELLRMANPDNQPSWIDVVECFGSYEEAFKHV